MRAFVDTVLCYASEGKDLKGGLLGLTKGYFGCVEAQGRGTLHCHMLVWVHGGLNPNQIRHRVVNQNDLAFRDRLIEVLDDTIANFVPPDPGEGIQTHAAMYHPCAVRGPSLGQDNAQLITELQKDLHLLVKACQQHVHTETCWKYCREGEPKECRFNLDEGNHQPKTFFDMDLGELHLRHVDGMVNNYNPTILQALRCNMDIKFVGLGPLAKAVMYYITDYITKSQLKVHVAYAALRMAVDKLNGLGLPNDAAHVTESGRRLLQKCAHAMIANQELSGPQVAAYLLGFGDHYTSHRFCNVLWKAFEDHVDRQWPSQECYQTVGQSAVPDALPGEGLPSQSTGVADEPEQEDDLFGIHGTSEQPDADEGGRIEDYIHRDVTLAELTL
ncbi:hypothetical protein CALCODRAFT_414823, partial [Calocera cornea HHB12733]